MPPVGPQLTDIKFFQQDLGRGITGTTTGQWADVSRLESLTVTVSGVPGVGAYDVLICNLSSKPADSDTVHPSIFNGPQQQIGFTVISYPVKWIKFVTTGVAGTLDCGIMGWVKTL